MTKKIKDNLDDVIQVRVTTFEKNRFKFSAKLYGYKNLSEFMISCATNFPREFLKKENMPRSRKKEGDLVVPDFLIDSENS